ncbi:MAG: type III pantothenate kinase [Anaerolineaceae bacterium]|nr:type III pantothenate kinase [Anaerolineaceae bacterium]
MTQSLLAIDIGNSNSHFGLWQGGRWAHTWRARSEPRRMPDEHAVLLLSLLQGVGLDYGDVDGVVIGSVVPALTAAYGELAPRYLRREPLLVTHETDSGLRIDIDQPWQAGADRIAAAAAALALYGAPALVIDFGTATTFDVITADGAWRGGAIAPGIGISHDALVQRTARLHAIDLAPPPQPLGRNTIHAMQSGIFWGYVGLVEGLVDRLRPSAGDDPRVIATGGLAELFSRHLPLIDVVAPLLALDGLRLIYERNC